MTVSDARRRAYQALREDGFTKKEASSRTGFSYATAKRYDQGKDNDLVPKLNGNLVPEARRALGDFAYFQRRYFGRIPVPWQEEAAEQVIKYLESPEEEFLVVNAPPGSGKSTLFTLDLAAWITVRNRAIRGLIGSYTLKQASWYTARLKRALEATIPAKAEAAELAAGRAVDAEVTLAHDYGRFKPEDKDKWAADQFVVAQIGGATITEKEATWQAFGMDSGFLGGRYQIVIWDDVVDPKRMRHVETKEAMEEWWDEYAETRLEPGGLLVLQGQRLATDDLYSYCLHKKGWDDEDEEDDWTGDVEELSDNDRKKYHHVVFKAHYEDKCQGKKNHGRNAPPYPEGCLLYPARLPMRKIGPVMLNNKSKFHVLYQQEDVDPGSSLVHPDWVSGKNGHPGCWDKDRDRLGVPKGLEGEVFSVASADPSPTRFWSVQWWLYHPATEQRFLMDMERRVMEAPDFLDFNYNEGKFTGLMDEWQQTSRDLGKPITHWIVEANAAQRFMLQYDHVRRWAALNSVEIIPHQTHRNKSDPDYGVETIAPHWQFGRIRLPGKDGSQGRRICLQLIQEVTQYPDTRTDDCLMAHWFVEWNIPSIYSPRRVHHKVTRPSWLTGRRRVA